MHFSILDELKKRLRPGRVYRRQEVAQWTNAVDRHLKALTDDGTFKKLRTGLYYYPKKFEFGEAPAEEHKLVKAFLRTHCFVVTSPNAYNKLGLGTTQLYNKRVVYNQRRHGFFNLGGRTYNFQRRMNIPKKLTQEFLLVDLVNELDKLAEDYDSVLKRVHLKANQMNYRRLLRAVSLYGNYSTQKLFQRFFTNV